MAHKRMRVVSYVRDMTIRTGKFVEFQPMLRESRGKVDAVLVQSPQVLGDTYDELVAKLNKLADAELGLVIVPSAARGNDR